MSKDYQMRKNPSSKEVNALLNLGYKIIAIKHGTKTITQKGFLITSEDEVFIHFLGEKEDKNE